MDDCPDRVVARLRRLRRFLPAAISPTMQTQTPTLRCLHLRFVGWSSFKWAVPRRRGFNFPGNL
jgi:hypothetical protein